MKPKTKLILKSFICTITSHNEFMQAVSVKDKNCKFYMVVLNKIPQDVRSKVKYFDEAKVSYFGVTMMSGGTPTVIAIKYQKIKPRFLRGKITVINCNGNYIDMLVPW